MTIKLFFSMCVVIACNCILHAVATFMYESIFHTVIMPWIILIFTTVRAVRQRRTNCIWCKYFAYLFCQVIHTFIFRNGNCTCRLIDLSKKRKKNKSYIAFPQRIKTLVPCNEKLQRCKTKKAIVGKRFSHIRCPWSHFCCANLPYFNNTIESSL